MNLSFMQRPVLPRILQSGTFLILLAVISWTDLSRAEVRTLKRIDDPVVIQGKALKPILGVKLERLSLMTWTDEGFKPVPFQVDEKIPKGEYAFTHGPKARKDPDPLLDKNDELVFMINVAGPKSPPGSWPGGAARGVELSLADPLDKGQGWVYLFAFEDDPPRSNVDLVKFDLDFSKKRIHVETPDFIIENPTDTIYPDVMRMIHEDGRVGPDVIDRFKMRAVVKTLGEMVTIKVDFDDIARSEPTAWIDGPVRVLYRAESYLDLSLFEIRSSGSGYSIMSYYPNHLIWPMTMESSDTMDPLVSSMEVFGYMDWNQNIFGTHPYDQFNPYNPEVTWDGKVNEAEKALNSTEDREWIAGFGPEGAIVFRIIMPPRQRGVIIKQLHFMDDITLEDPPEDDVGVTCWGLKLTGYEKLEPGEKETTYQYYYFLKTLTPGDEKKILDIIDHPLRITVYAVESSN